jgi:hypothetical protein
LHQRIFDLLHANAADYTLDESAIWVHRRRLREEGVEVRLLLDLMLQTRLVIARQPADDAVDLFLVRPLRLAFSTYRGYTAANGVEKIRCPAISASWAARVRIG